MLALESTDLSAWRDRREVQGSAHWTRFCRQRALNKQIATARGSDTFSASDSTSAALQWFQHAGKRCREEETLGTAGVTDGSFLQLHLRLRGGGGDGGATGAESRSSYLEMYLQKKPDKVNLTGVPSSG